jgi:hypothetical protein
MALSRPLSLAVLTVASACAVDDVPAEEAPDTTVVYAGARCGPDELMCGKGNSPEIDQLGVDTLNLDGAQSKNGFVIDSFKKGTRSYTLRVKGAKLEGLDQQGRVALTGTQLIGAEIRLLNKINLSEYSVKFREVLSLDYWLQLTSTTRRTESYLLEWAIIRNGNPGEYKNICNNVPADNSDTYGMNRFHMLMTEGDEVDKGLRLVRPTTDRWINLPCAGSLWAKMHLLGVTQAAANQTAGQANAYTSTTDERTAGVRMFSAAYAGTRSFSVPGVPLHVIPPSLIGSFTQAALPPNVTIESFWNEKGTQCLNQPRAELHQTMTAVKEAFPDGVMVEIERDAPKVLGMPCAMMPPAGAMWGAFNVH